ncbi:MAG: lipopolysaccharide assembly protein LapA domain-containing protein [Caldimonas sp.]
MRILVWLIRAAVFFTLFVFALNNRETSKISLFFGYEWQAPMVFIVLAVFALGVAFGIFAMVPSWWRHRRSARREAARSPPASPSAPPASHVVDAEPMIVHPPRDGL